MQGDPLQELGTVVWACHVEQKVAHELHPDDNKVTLEGCLYPGFTAWCSTPFPSRGVTARKLIRSASTGLQPSGGAVLRWFTELCASECLEGVVLDSFWWHYLTRFALPASRARAEPPDSAGVGLLLSPQPPPSVSGGVPVGEVLNPRREKGRVTALQALFEKSKPGAEGIQEDAFRSISGSVLQGSGILAGLRYCALGEPPRSSDGGAPTSPSPAGGAGVSVVHMVSRERFLELLGAYPAALRSPEALESCAAGHFSRLSRAVVGLLMRPPLAVKD
eukprot:RCo004637